MQPKPQMGTDLNNLTQTKHEVSDFANSKVTFDEVRASEEKNTLQRLIEVQKQKIKSLESAIESLREEQKITKGSPQNAHQFGSSSDFLSSSFLNPESDLEGSLKDLRRQVETLDREKAILKMNLQESNSRLESLKNSNTRLIGEIGKLQDIIKTMELMNNNSQVASSSIFNTSSVLYQSKY